MNETYSNTGIVLKTFLPDKYKVIIFDRSLGKFDAIVPSTIKHFNLCNGLLVNYNYQLKGKLQFIDNINIINDPFLLAQNDLLFFHHILELCYYFIPMGISCDDLFDFIKFLFFSPQKLKTVKSQKILLCRFFLLLGMYPECKTSPKFNYLMSIPIDIVDNELIDLENEKELNLWIIKCINIHPYAKSFKTINFLTEVVIS